MYICEYCQSKISELDAGMPCKSCGAKAYIKDPNYVPPTRSSTTPRIQTNQNESAQGLGIGQHESKSKLVAILLVLFLGMIGVNNFYLGQNGQGIVKLILTCAFWPITFFWSICELIYYLFGKPTDANGNPLT